MSIAKTLLFSKTTLSSINGRLEPVLRNLKLDWLVSKMVKKTGQVKNKLAPGWTVSRIDNLLFAPQNRKQVSVQTPKDFRAETIRTSGGGVHAISTGSGPMVVFIHGWGGSAYQFFPLMRGLAGCGFTVLAIDHLGHGQSDSKPTTLQQSIDTTSAVIQHVRKNARDGLAAIVGHSTGCIAIASTRPTLINNIPLFLISPIFNYKLFLLKRLVKFKIPPEAAKHYAAQFGKTFKQTYGKINLTTNLAQFADVSVIAHDEGDTESAVGDSIKFCLKHPLTRLLITKKSDHNRIINSESVWQELKSAVNYDDTTISYADAVFQR